MNVSIIAGGAGFIGCNLLPMLAQEGRQLVILDNLSRGQERYLGSAKSIAHDRIHFFNTDLSDRSATLNVFKWAKGLGFVDEVWHLAANSDIPAGVIDPMVDLKDTFLTTFEILNAMKECDIRSIHFASSSAIYGDLGSTLLHEGIGPLLPISNYGAMKLASEAQISAAAENFLERANIFRFPNVVGTPATHGVILDFINKLYKNDNVLNVLGNGTQQKSYLHVSDLVNALLLIRSKSIKGNVEVVNVGPIDEGITVKSIAEKVVANISPNAQIIYGEGGKGWVGDVPKFTYSTERLQSYGWLPKLNSAQAIERAINEISLELAK
ncbi:NAD-dependent epimerase/dehydratase family protein [Polynucleobacter sp. MWH-Jannik1A5]|nr:NAD-dependent epimerase/dehydratase family protein [Polynucleobacter sp. MWH-Jannik1A5]